MQFVFYYCELKSSNLAIFSQTLYTVTGELHVCLLPHVWHLSFTLTYTTFTFLVHYSVTLSQAALNASYFGHLRAASLGQRVSYVFIIDDSRFAHCGPCSPLFAFF